MLFSFVAFGIACVVGFILAASYWIVGGVTYFTAMPAPKSAPLVNPVQSQVTPEVKPEAKPEVKYYIATGKLDGVNKIEVSEKEAVKLKAQGVNIITE